MNDVRHPFVLNVQVAWICQVIRAGQVAGDLQVVRAVTMCCRLTRCFVAVSMAGRRHVRRVMQTEDCRGEARKLAGFHGPVLHTWKQTLESHVHVHAFVPGGGPSLTTPGTWKTARPPVHLRQDRPWLVDADELRVAFRTEFLQGLRSLHRRGRLKLTGD